MIGSPARQYCDHTAWRGSHSDCRFSAVYISVCDVWLNIPIILHTGVYNNTLTLTTAAVCRSPSLALLSRKSIVYFSVEYWKWFLIMPIIMTLIMILTIRRPTPRAQISTATPQDFILCFSWFGFQPNTLFPGLRASSLQNKSVRNFLSMPNFVNRQTDRPHNVQRETSKNNV